MIEQAMKFTIDAHSGQFRNDGHTPYVFHCFEVAKMVSALGIKDESVIAAALLHDTIEDADVMSYEIEDEFDSHVAKVVVELTHNPTQQTKEDYIRSFEKKTIEANVIKFCDRVCNINDFLPSSYARTYFNRAQIVFTRVRDKVPVCHRFSEEVYKNILYSYYLCQLSLEKV